MFRHPDVKASRRYNSITSLILRDIKTELPTLSWEYEGSSSCPHHVQRNPLFSCHISNSESLRGTKQRFNLLSQWELGCNSWFLRKQFVVSWCRVRSAAQMSLRQDTSSVFTFWIISIQNLLTLWRVPMFWIRWSKFTAHWVYLHQRVSFCVSSELKPRWTTCFHFLLLYNRKSTEPRIQMLPDRAELSIKMLRHQTLKTWLKLWRRYAWTFSSIIPLSSLSAGCHRALIQSNRRGPVRPWEDTHSTGSKNL